MRGFAVAVVLLSACERGAPPSPPVAAPDLAAPLDRSAIAACEKKYAESLRAPSLDKLRLGGPCDAPLDTPAVGGSTLDTLDTKYFKRWPLITVGQGHSPSADGCQSRTGSFEAVVWVDSSEKPTTSPESLGTAFNAGRIQGRAAVYDYGTGRVVCAGTVDVTSSTTVRMRVNWMGQPQDGDHALGRDLAAQLRRAIKAQLKTVVY